MKYKKIRTPQGEILYVGKEKHLYTRHVTSKKKSIWTCYQKTICKRKVISTVQLAALSGFPIHNINIEYFFIE